MWILSLKIPTSSVKWFIGIQRPCDRSLLYFGNRNQNIILGIWIVNSIFVIHLWILSSICLSMMIPPFFYFQVSLTYFLLTEPPKISTRLLLLCLYKRDHLLHFLFSLWDYQVKLSGGIAYWLVWIYTVTPLFMFSQDVFCKLVRFLLFSSGFSSLIEKERYWNHDEPFCILVR